jgi:hypothetical protein
MAEINLPEELWHDFELSQRESAASALKAKFEAIKSRSRVRIAFDRFYLSLFSDESYSGYSNNADMVDTLLNGLRERLNENVIQRIVSTFCTKLSKSRPRPSVLTDNADWSLLQRAKIRDRAIWGAMHAVRAYELQRQADVHMAICGTGGIFVGHRAGRPYAEVVPPWECFVDTSEARYGKPRTLYRQHFMDRRLAMRLWKKFKNQIKQARCASGDDIAFTTGSDDADMIELVTAWRLPSFPGAEDGKLIVITDDVCLEYGDWKRDHFPIAWSRFLQPPRGFFGIGATQTLVGLQLELNRTLAYRQEAMSLIKPYVLCESGSKVVETDFSDEVGNFIWYTGTKPEIVTPSAVHPETFQHSDRVKASMFSQVGLNEMVASSFKPAGVNSGRAIRAYSDMVDDQIHDVLLRREQQMVDFGELLLDALEDIDESEGEKKPIVYVGPFGTEKIDYSKFSDDRDSFVLRVQPTSSLSTQLSGKFEDLEDMRSLGLIEDPQEMEDLLQMPDLTASTSRRNSMRELIREVLEVQILDKGNYVPPDPDWDHERCLKEANRTRLYAQLRGAPADRIELLRQFEQKCVYFINEAAKAELDQQASGGMIPSDESALPPDAPVDGAPPESFDAGMPAEM